MIIKMKFAYINKENGKKESKLFDLVEVEEGKSREFTKKMEAKGYVVERVVLDDSKEE